MSTSDLSKPPNDNWTQEDWDWECQSVRRLWKEGRCFCCGEDEFDNAHDGSEPTMIRNDVKMCGYCVYRGHDRSDVLPTLLQMLDREFNDSANVPVQET